MDPFATLGLPPRYDLDPSQLEARYRELQRALHPDRHAGASASTRRLSAQKTALVNDAYRTLRDDLRRAEALIAAHGGAALLADRAADPEFLLQMLELREQLGEAQDEGNNGRVDVLTAQVSTLQSAARAELAETFRALGAASAPELQAKAADLVARLKYFRRFLHEVTSHAEEEL
jgi:molecular chaperone HscB